MNQSLVILKPDAVERGLIGTVISRLEQKGLHLVAGDLRTIDAELAKRHYEEHKDRPFFDHLVAFITRSPSFLCVVEGPEDTWKIIRTLVGATNPAEAAPGTIRGDYATETSENIIHASDGPESAAREIALFFPDLD